jgi:hypothetical protein
VAITAVNKLAEATGTDGSSFTTAGTLTPQANRLYLAAVTNSASSPATVTLSGGGLTWDQVATVTVWQLRITLFRALSASPGSASALTASASSTQTGWTIIVAEFDGVSTQGTNGSGAIVQSNTNSAMSGTNGSVTLSAFEDATNNAAFAVWEHVVAENTTPETGWTELADITRTGPARGTETEWRLGEDTTPSASWATSEVWAGIAVEIRAAPSSPAGPPAGSLALLGVGV